VSRHASGVCVLGRAPGVNREDARQLGTVVAAWKQMAVHSMVIATEGIATRIATGLNGTDRDKSGTEQYPSSKKPDKMG
jgi:hypothetical protein